MIKELLDKQNKYLNTFFKHIDVQKAEAILDILHKCQGVVLLSGVGKSGLIAEKIAMTLTSTGTKSLYISPLNALHGDIGITSANDVFLLMSKSGETEELLQLIPFLRNKGVTIISIVSNSKSRLAKASDLFIDLPLEQELCPFDMAPTTSAVIQLIFGDLLAVGLMQKKNFSLDDYFQNHPAGRIGKRISIKVADLMVKDEHLPICYPEDKLVDTLIELSNKRCGCILIVNQDKQLKGIFTDGDLRRSLQKHGAASLDFKMQDLMTEAARFVEPDKLAYEAMKEMEGDQKNAITVLPVLENGKHVIGLIKLHDIIQSGI